MIKSLLDRRNWMEDAACRQTDIFFSTGNEELDMKAKMLCFRCPVQLECLKYCFETGSTSGIWGGYDEKERRQIKRRQMPIVIGSTGEEYTLRELMRYDEAD